MKRVSRLPNHMNWKGKLLWVLFGGVLFLILGIVAYVGYSVYQGNDLGLTASDMAMGKTVDIESLRTKTKLVADAYLTKRHAELTDFCGEDYKLNVAYDLSPKIRSFGYRSSFYYFCWDIYLPYALHTQSRGTFTLVVQLSDGVPGNKHDLDRFRVLRAMLIDEKGQVTKTFEP